MSHRLTKLLKADHTFGRSRPIRSSKHLKRIQRSGAARSYMRSRNLHRSTKLVRFRVALRGLCRPMRRYRVRATPPAHAAAWHACRSAQPMCGPCEISRNLMRPRPASHSLTRSHEKAPPPRGDGAKIAGSTLFAPCPPIVAKSYEAKISIVSPSARVTMAFFQVRVRPSW